MSCMEIIIAILAVIVALLIGGITIYFTRKNARIQLFMMLTEKESLYATDWNSNPDSEDKLWQYVNLFEIISLLYNKNEIDKKLIKESFKIAFTGVYSEYKKEIDEKISKGDFSQLNKLLKNWELK